MNWRPANWNNPYFIVERVGMDTETSYNKYPEFQIYEDGAGAMLEALYKMAEESPTKTFTIDSRRE